MPDILATSKAPKSTADLEKLLENDIKVKVAGVHLSLLAFQMTLFTRIAQVSTVRTT